MIGKFLFMKEGKLYVAVEELSSGIGCAGCVFEEARRDNVFCNAPTLGENDDAELAWCVELNFIWKEVNV